MSQEVSIQELLQTPEAWDQIWKENGQLDEKNKVTLKEAFLTPDAPILFQKVISNTLREAAEAPALVTPMLDTIRINSRTLEIPAVNAIQAAIIPEAQEYPEQALAFERQVEGKVSKKGVKVVFSDEVIADSQWDIVGLHVRAAGRAMARKKEQIALDRFRDAAVVVFDNTGGVATTGLGATGTVNQTLSWQDFLTMAAAIHAENHVPTDLIIHPLMWPVFLGAAQFQNSFSPNSGWNQNVSSKAGVANATAPLGLNVQLSPYVSFTPAVGQTPAKSDIFLVDRNEIGALLVRDDLGIDEWTDQTRDLQALKMRERYDIICYGDGEGIAVAKDVSLAPSYSVQLNKTVA